MRMPAIIIGAILLIIGGLITAGVFKFQSTEKVADIGPIEITKTDTKTETKTETKSESTTPAKSKD